MGAGGPSRPPLFFKEVIVTPLRTAIFVDGANFRANLRNFSFSSPSPSDRGYRLEERHFDWKRFYDDVIQKFNEATGWKHRLIRVHWYYAQTISPWAYSGNYASAQAEKILSRYPQICGLTHEKVIDKAREWYRRERERFERLREVTFENIQRETDFLEFKYVGQYQVRPLEAYRIDQNDDGEITYLGRQVGEKGVDIGIAVDMIAKMPYYDVAILVSGDADFLPVVGYLKDHLKHVYQFSIAKGVPPSIKHLSPYLEGMVDCFASYDEQELLTQYLDRRSGIPLPILKAIDARLSDLTNSATHPTSMNST